jgi:hypothetical protein
LPYTAPGGNPGWRRWAWAVGPVATCTLASLGVASSAPAIAIVATAPGGFSIVVARR